MVNGVYWGQTGSIWVNWGQLRSIMVISGQSGLIGGHFGSIVLEVSCIKFWLSVTSGTPSKTPLSTISWLDPLRTCWFLMHTVWILNVLQVSWFKFQLSVTSGTPSKTPYPPSPGWILWGHVGSWCILYGYLMSFRFHDSNFSSLWHQEHHQRPPIHHLLVGSFEDMLVPDAYCMDSWCPWGFMFQISALCDIRNTIKDPPIHHFLIGSLEDIAVSSTPMNWSWEPPQIGSSNVQNWSTVSSILMLYIV